MATQYSQKLQLTGLILGQTPSISGYDVETGNATIGVTQFFPASSSNVSITLAFTLANLQSIVLLASQQLTIITNGTATADVQTITITGTPTGGDFAVDFGGQVTVIPYNASASTVQTALQALSTVGSGNITCTGGPLPGTPVVCTFAGTKATGQQQLMNSYGNFTGGSSPAVAITHTTPGKPTNSIVLQPGIPLAWGVSAGYFPCPFTSNVTSAYVSCTNASNLQIQGTSL